MENDMIKALVMQADDDTALLLCKGGQIIRVKNTSAWKVGDDILYSYEEELPEKKNKNYKLKKLFIKVAACFIVFITGLLAAREIPVRSEQLLDCIEVRTNIYGVIIDAKPINEQGIKVLDVIESKENSDGYMTENVSDYLETIKSILSSMEFTGPVSNLTETQDFGEYYDAVPDGLKDELETAIESDDTQAIDELSQDLQEQLAQDLYELKHEEFKAAYDLFGYSHDTEKIYPALCGVNMQANVSGVSDAITLLFFYIPNETVPDFSNAEVYLYDLTTGKEIVSSIKKNLPSNKKAGANGLSTELYFDSSNMVPYNGYYVKIKGAIFDGAEINNIYYAFEYVPEGSTGFRVMGFPAGKPDYSAANSALAASPTLDPSPTLDSAADGVINWQDPAVEAIVRQALRKETGDITKAEATGYTGWLILYRKDIKTIEDLQWFPRLSYLTVRADLIQDASILPTGVYLSLYFDGLTSFSDINSICNFEEINKTLFINLIIRPNNGDLVFRLGETDVNLQFANNIKDLSGIEVLLKFKNLSSIDLSDNGFTDISSLKCLSELNTLYNLDLSNNGISDIGILKDFTNLRGLTLDNNQIEDISCLSELKELFNISLNSNKVTDISALSKLYLLDFISLNGNQIKDISPLAGLDPRNLYLGSNMISDISCLKEMKYISILGLENNFIEDITSLKNLPSSAYVYLFNNPISDFSPVDHVEIVGK